MVDVAEFETALVNLVINARDAMPGGGVITISAHNDTLGDEAGAGDYVAISVEDTGAGIAPDMLSKIFDPFFTTKPIGKGTGLGLSQVHGFAHQAGGTVKVTSELGKGTKITILLPRKEAGPAVEESHGAETGGSGTVLLVEDNPDVASVSASLLEQLGYTVRRVADAEAALREIELDGIDLVFSDIVMPGKMDGLGLARHLKAIRPGLPILLASGYSDAALNVRGDFPDPAQALRNPPAQPGDRETAAVTGWTASTASSPSQDRLERAAQRFVPEHEAVAERLVRQHALAAQQQFIGEIAADPAQQRGGNPEHRGPAQPPAEFLGEFQIGDRDRRRRIDRARDVRACDHMRDQADRDRRARSRTSTACPSRAARRGRIRTASASA